jgi:hypothetical protein
LPLAAAVAANLLILAVLVIGALLRGSDSELFYLSVQEDEYLEWATVWAFAIAAVVYVFVAARWRRTDGRLPWFCLGVGLFCLFVALEEISWGQRLLGYRPPVYFLEHNFQQELNFHNVVGSGLRKLALKGVILGYGMVLPLLAMAPVARRWLDRLGIVAPSSRLIPAFAATALFYQSYPWSFTGELVELMLGLGFLFAGLHLVGMLDRVGARIAGRRVPGAAVVGLGGALIIGLGFANAAFSRAQRSASAGALEAAETEVAALKRDFEVMAWRSGGRPATRCGVHKRVYSWVEKYGREELHSGNFARLVDQGLPEERADFFIDPWNTAYWIRHRCTDNGRRQTIFVYSFGPNRRRESTEWELGGDDVGAVILSTGSSR